MLYNFRPDGGKCDALYLRPRRYTTDTCWYSDIPFGVHQIQKPVSQLCQEAGFKDITPIIHWELQVQPDSIQLE